MGAGSSVVFWGFVMPSRPHLLYVDRREGKSIRTGLGESAGEVWPRACYGGDRTKVGRELPAAGVLRAVIVRRPVRYERR